jgi:hypothetical protein
LLTLKQNGGRSTQSLCDPKKESEMVPFFFWFFLVFLKWVGIYIINKDKKNFNMRTIRLTENELSRIVRKIVNEEEESMQSTNWPLCDKVGVTQGSFEGEKEGFGFLRYDVGENNRPVTVGSGGTPKMCKFQKRKIITIQR